MPTTKPDSAKPLARDPGHTRTRESHRHSDTASVGSSTERQVNTHAPQKSTAPGALPSGLEVEARLKLEQVCQLTGYGRSKVYHAIKHEGFPAPERRGVRCSRWRAGDVMKWLEATRAAGLEAA